MDKKKHTFLTNNLFDLAKIFLKFGIIGFGGPYAVVAMMENEFVEKRGWIKKDLFMDILGAINLVPGPIQVKMAAYIGYLQSGVFGLFIAGAFFLIPPTLITMLLGIYYREYGSVTSIQTVLSILTTIIIAIIFASAYRIGKSALKNLPTWFIAIGCFILALLGINSILVLITGGVAGLFFYVNPFSKGKSILLFGFPYKYFICSLISINNRLSNLFFYFLKIGSILFGGGEVLFAYINNDIVSGFGWLSQKQLVDAIAVGQVTPGPVSKAVTFIGYLLEGIPGAVLVTVAFFLPAFIIILILGKVLPGIRKNPVVQSIFEGINAGVVGLILIVGLALLRNSPFDLLSLVTMITCTFLLIKYKIDPAILILIGVGFGLIKLFAPN